MFFLMCGFAILIYYLLSRPDKRFSEGVDEFKSIIKECTSRGISGYEREKNIKLSESYRCKLRGYISDRLNERDFWFYSPNLKKRFYIRIKFGAAIQDFDRGDEVIIEFIPSFQLNSIARACGNSVHELKYVLEAEKIFKIQK